MVLLRVKTVVVALYLKTHSPADTFQSGRWGAQMMLQTGLRLVPEALRNPLLGVLKLKARACQKKLQPKNLLEILELEVRLLLGVNKLL